MQHIDPERARQDARTALNDLTGHHSPHWRMIDQGEECGPATIGPHCDNPEHDPDDSACLYVCCPDPVISTGNAEIAAYLVVLLNADQKDR